MTGLEKIGRGYRVSVHPLKDETGIYRVSYAPRGLQQPRGVNGEFPRVPPASVAVVRVQAEIVQVIGWENPPTGDRDSTQADFEQDATTRVRLLHDWFSRLSPLVRSVEGWARELGWATRVIDKWMEDSEIGKYQAPALLMQEGIVRVLLEPLGRSSPGTEGVVDLYLMPAYDDIATLYFYDGCWNLHDGDSKTASVETVREAPSKPLSKETLQEVLDKLKQNAA